MKISNNGLKKFIEEEKDDKSEDNNKISQKSTEPIFNNASRLHTLFGNHIDDKQISK
jgi:hypothetical protein